MKKKKRILSLLLALLIVMSSLPANVFAVGVAYTTDYATHKDGTAVFNPELNYVNSDGVVEYYGSAYISGDPTKVTNIVQEQALSFEGLMETKFVILDVYVSDSGYWYKLGAAEGHTLPTAMLTKPWVYQNDLPTPMGLDALIVTPPAPTPDDPELPTISDTVTDSEGNFVTDANGNPLTITVSGEGIPEGAVVSASIPEINGEKLPNVFDIKVLAPNAEGELVEWQPIDYGKTVNISIPVEGDYATVTHIIDYAPAIVNNPSVEHISLEGLSEEELELLKDAVAASNRPGYFAVEIQANVLITDGIATFSTNSFSYYNMDGDLIPQTAIFIYCDDGTGTSLADQKANPDENKHNLPVLREDGVYDNGEYYIPTTGTGQSGNKITIQCAWEGVVYKGGFLNLQNKNDAKITVYREKVSNPGVRELWNGISDTSFTEMGNSGQVGRNIAKYHLAIDLSDPEKVQGDKYYITIVDSKNNCTASFMIIIADIEKQYSAILTDSNGRFENQNIDYYFDEEKETQKLPSTSAEGYELTGWKVQEPIGNWASGQTYAVGTPLANKFGNVTLLAQWSPLYKYNIKFESGTSDDVDLPEGYTSTDWEKNTKHTINLSTKPHREGYIFMGWTVSTGAVLESTDTTFDVQGIPADTANVAFTARWRADDDTAYTVNHYYEKLDGTFDVQSITHYGVTDTLTNEKPFTDKVGYIIPAVEDIVQKNINGDGSTVIDIYYYLASYQTTWIAEGQDEPIVVWYKYGATIIQADTPNLTGYSFDHWDGYVDNMTMPAYNLTFTAIWKAKVFSVIFQTDGGSYVAPKEPAYNTDVTLTEEPTREGYEFAGWEVVSGLNQTELKTGDSFKMPDEDVVLKAKWNVNEYTITFLPENGETSTSEKYAYGTSLTKFDPPANKPAGYKFAAWMYEAGDQWVDITDSDGNVKLPNGATQYNMPAYNITLKARWELALVDLTIQVSGNPDADQNFVFVVTNSSGTQVARVVLYSGKKTITVKDLPVGNYTVTPLSGWAWRQNLGAQTVAVDDASNEVTFTWNAIDAFIYWLNGYGYKKKGG